MKKRLRKLDAAALTRAWLEERFNLQPLTGFLAAKTVPIHRFSLLYVFGGAALFFCALQIVTGCLLLLYYQPTQEGAYESVQRIMRDIPYGWLFRSLHVWGAHFFIAAVLLHLCTVLFARLYRKPRELLWLSGAALLVLCLGLGFTGYLLPWNELSYYATLVGTQVPSGIPVVGPWLSELMRGGDSVTNDTLTRFFAAHIVILPLGLGLMLSLHLLLVQLLGSGVPLGMRQQDVKDRMPFFSEFVLYEAALWLVLLGAAVSLAVLFPAELGIKADPLRAPPDGIRPEWYFLFLFQTLKLVPESSGLLLFAVIAAFLFFLPFLDTRAAREAPSNLFRAGLAVLAVAALVLEAMALWASGPIHPQAALQAPTYLFARNLVSLALMWGVIVYLVCYLLALRRENGRIRALYAAAAEVLPEGGGTNVCGSAPATKELL